METLKTQDRRETMRELRTPSLGRADGPGTEPGVGKSGGGDLLAGLAILACPLLCAGPLLVAGLASTGLIRALRGAPWPLIVGAVLVVLALGVGGTRARQARNCCPPTPTRPFGDGLTR